MKYAMIALVLVCLCPSMQSCNKNDKDDPANNIDTSTYLPNTFINSKVGTWWEYGSSGDSGVHDYTRYALGIDTIVENYPMTYYHRKDHVTGYYTPEFFGTYGDKLVTMIPLDKTQENYLPYVFFIRGSEVGSSWENTGNASYMGINADVKIESELIETNLSMNWTGKSFDSVYHVKSEIYATGANIHSGTLELWFNDGLGIVKGTADFDIMGVYSKYYRDSLIDYHIEL